jgi:plasmid stabilization system protein ParE
VARDNATAAAQLILQIALSVRRLGEFPLSGRVVPEFEGIGIREIIVRRYRIAYQVGDEVEILKVQHGARLLRRADLV